MRPLIHQHFVDRCLSPRGIQWTVKKCKTLGQFCESLYKQELLGDDNWVAWKLRMTNVFSLHKVIDHVISHVPKLDISNVTVLAEWTDKDKKAKTLLFMSVGNDNLVHLSDSETAAQMWDNLRAVCKVKGHQMIIVLRRSLYHLATNSNNDIPKHLIKTKQM